MEKKQLTNTEILVCENIATGKENEEIARELGISANTVRTHVQNILKKINKHKRLDIVLFWLENKKY